jgi:hypothetical protein
LIALLLVVVWLFLLTAGGAGLVHLLSLPDRDERNPLHAGWCFLVGSAIAAFLLHVPLAIDGSITKKAFLIVVSLFLALAMWPGLAHVRKVGIERFLGLDLARGLPVSMRVIVAALVLLSISVAFEPFSGWDERAVYGLKARVLFHEGSVRVEEFTDSDNVHFQARYPLLVPLLEASLLTIKDSADDLFLKLLFVLYGLSLVLLVADEASRLDGPRVGAFWGFILMTTPFLIGPGDGHGMTGGADLPLAAYATGAAVLLGRTFARPAPGVSILAGVLVGAALMTKQEGIIWALAFAFALALAQWRRTTATPALLAREAAAVAAPALLFFAVSIAARRWIPSSIWSDRYGIVFSLDWLSQLASRPLEIAPYVLRELGGWQNWGWGWLLVLCGLVVLRRPRLSPVIFFWRTLGITVFAAFLATFVVTPYHVHWHLATAFRRLLLQLFPLAILILAEQVSASGWIRQGLAALARSSAPAPNDSD